VCVRARARGVGVCVRVCVCVGVVCACVRERLIDFAANLVKIVVCNIFEGFRGGTASLFFVWCHATCEGRMPLHCLVVFTSVAVSISVCGGVRFVLGSCYIFTVSRDQQEQQYC
jgi:hypothetical protein